MVLNSDSDFLGLVLSGYRAGNNRRNVTAFISNVILNKFIMPSITLRACLYDPCVPGRPGVPGSRLVDNLLLFSRLRLYGDRDVPPDRDPG